MMSGISSIFRQAIKSGIKDSKGKPPSYPTSFKFDLPASVIDNSIAKPVTAPKILTGSFLIFIIIYFYLRFQFSLKLFELLNTLLDLQIEHLFYQIEFLSKIHINFVI